MSKYFERVGIFPFILLGLFVAGDILLTLITLSPAKQDFVDFYTKNLPIFLFPYIFLFFSLLTEIAFDIPLGPFGSVDNTFPLQKLFGWNVAFIIFVLFSIGFGLFIYNSVVTSKEVWIPAPELLRAGLQVPFAGDIREFLSGFDVMGNAIANSIPPALKEDPIFIYSFMLLLWVPIRIAGKFLGFEGIANIIGMVAFIVGATVMFPIAHSFAYQEVAPAYQKATMFVGICATVTGISGFPACTIPHLSNNWAASEQGLTSSPRMIFIPAGLIIVPFLNKRRKKK